MSAFRRYKAEPDYWNIDEEEKKKEKEEYKEVTRKINRIYNSIENHDELDVCGVETFPYMVHEDYHNYYRKMNFFAIFVFVLFMITVSGTIYTLHKTQETSTHENTSSETSNDFTSILYDDIAYIGDINIMVSNEYGTYSGAKYEWLTNKYLAEPYKTTTLAVNNTIIDSMNVYWKWREEDSGLETWGNSIEKIFTSPGEYNIYLDAMNAKNETLTTHTIPIVVKYVKRELRALTNEDRHKFLHAASKIWKYTSSEGREKYGEKFTGINELVEEHALASNDIKCDQFHEGSGFFTHHFAITQTFEAALRSVDPSVTLPYWDFTIEGQQIKDANESPSYLLEITPFLNDKWFGSTDEDGHVQDSKFAFMKMPKITNESIV